MKSVALRERGVIARDELGKRFDSVRGQVTERVGEIDTKELIKQGESLREQSLDYVSRLRRALLQRGVPVHFVPDPRPRRRRRWPVPAVLAGVGVGAGVALAAYLLYDRRRREQLRERLTKVQSVAQERYVQLGGVTGAVHQVRSRVQQRAQSANGSDLSARVGEAIAAGGELPKGLNVEVEGRTVYLKGEVADAAVADAAAERAHTVEGVVAVVNHTTSSAPPKG